jgi:hypothetical protein
VAISLGQGVLWRLLDWLQSHGNSTLNHTEEGFNFLIHF